MRIAHISDIHVGLPPADPLSLVDKRILGSLNFLLRRRRKVHLEWLEQTAARLRDIEPDWIVCTGDLTSVSAPAEFALAERLLAPLLEVCPSRFIYVPGNHDAYVKSRPCRDALEATFKRLNGGRWQLSGLPAEHRLGNMRLFVVNECLPTNCFLSSGELPAKAMEQLQVWLDQPRVPGETRVLVGHFPLLDERGRPLGWRRHLANASLLHRALADGRLDVSVCGHIHSPFVRREESGSLEICAGALTIAGKINMMEFSPDAGNVSQYWIDVQVHG